MGSRRAADKIAHDYLIANYVCPSGKHYALEFRRFRKRDACEAERTRLDAQPGGFAAASEPAQRLATFKSHTVLCCELIDWVITHQIPGTFAFDSYFTNAAIGNHIAGHGRAYVGDLKFNRKVWFRGVELRADEMAAQIPVGDRKKVTVGERTQWYFTKKIWLPAYTHAVRVVILWEHWNSKEPVKILITNQTHWDVTRVLRGYGQRWTGTETLHRDGKQHLGLGDCQLRSGEGVRFKVRGRHNHMRRQRRAGPNTYPSPHSLGPPEARAWVPHCRLSTTPPVI